MNKDNKTSSSDEEQYDPVLKHFKELDKEKNQDESLSTGNESKLTFFDSLKQILIDTSNRYKFLKDKVFLCIVILPTLISILYFGFFASSIFISESKFIVKSSEQNQSLPLQGVAQVIFGQSPVNSFSVQDYVVSRDAMNLLIKKLDIKDEFSKKDVDFFGKFPGIRFWDKSLENFYIYYQTKVTVLVDPATSITTLTTKSFNSELTLKMNDTLLSLSEDLVNQLNDRLRADLIKSAMAEVDLAKNKYKELTTKINILRNKKNIVDTDKHISELQSLYLERGFTDKQIQAAMTSLETARAEAQKKQIYLEKISNPQFADYPLEPRRFLVILGIFIVSLIIWGITALMISGVKEHTR
jgi:capsular polysaccharide transport system permease protein